MLERDFGPNQFERLAQGSEARLAQIEAGKRIGNEEILVLEDPQTTLFSKFKESLSRILKPVNGKVAVPVSVVLLTIAAACSRGEEKIEGPRDFVNRDGPHIAFQSERDDNAEIYTMKPDGTDLRNLSNNSGRDGYLGNPWSPDGSRLVFMSDRDGNMNIYVMNADGSKVKRLTNDPEDDLWPVWSPDGSMVAFTSERDGNVEIYLINSDGSGLRNLTNNPADEGALGFTWSPDGKKIAYSSNRNFESQLFVIDIDGENETLLAHTDSSSDHILESFWSPDGSKIAFEMMRTMVRNEIFLVDVDKGGFIQITKDVAGVNPAWSPDSKFITFNDSPDLFESSDIFIIKSNGTGLVNLTNSDQSDDVAPSWSADGTKIVFTSDRDGDNEIYIMNADGSNLIRLTNNPASDSLPAWSPAQ